jgi:transposase-like protein
MRVEKNISQLARELGLDRSMIYNWQRKMDGRKSENFGPDEARIQPIQVQDLQAKIASLERVIGRQAVELDFFEGALRRIKERGQKSGTDGETSSTPRSEAGSKRKASSACSECVSWRA